MPQPLLFNKDVFIPDFAKMPLFEGKVSYGNHARNVTGQGHGNSIPLPPLFVAKDATLIEVELNPVSGEVEKQVWRQPLDADRDMCFAMIAGGFVKTVWLNDKRDTHATLRKDRFTTAYQWRMVRNKLGKK